MQLITLIIPCYNEEKSIGILYENLVRVANLIENYEIEMLFINDGSKDNTLSMVKEIGVNDRRVRFISFSRNFGKEAAMYCGFKNAKGDLVAVMDADMQDPPDLLPEMISYIESGEYDSVATRRISREGEPVIRSLCARMFYKVINKISDADVVDGARDFRLMTRDMVEAILEISEYNRFSKGIFGWIGFRTKWLPYKNIERVAGETKWSFLGLLKYSLDGIINFSQIPLALSSWFGIMATMASLVFIVFIVIRKLIYGDPVDGWASLICVITFFSGVQLFCIGILGQCLSKTYMEVKKRPHYIIGESNVI